MVSTVTVCPAADRNGVGSPEAAVKPEPPTGAWEDAADATSAAEADRDMCWDVVPSAGAAGNFGSGAGVVAWAAWAAIAVESACPAAGSAVAGASAVEAAEALGPADDGIGIPGAGTVPAWSCWAASVAGLCFAFSCSCTCSGLTAPLEAETSRASAATGAGPVGTGG